MKKISNFLLVLSIASILGALIRVNALSRVNQGFTENMWLFFLFLPIPISSIIFSFYLKKNRYKYRKNLIVGIIMTILLCIYGSFSFIFPDSIYESL